MVRMLDVSSTGNGTKGTGSSVDIEESRMSSRGQKGIEGFGREEMRGKNTRLGNKLAIVRKNCCKDDMEETDGFIESRQKDVKSCDMDR